MQFALEEVISGSERDDIPTQERGWKLFFLLPRMLLARPGRGGLVPRRKLENRFEMFFSGQWSSLIADARMISEAASTARVRKRRRQGDGRAVRAEKLAMMGELSSARQALESTGVALGDQNSLNALRSPQRRLRNGARPEV